MKEDLDQSVLKYRFTHGRTEKRNFKKMKSFSIPSLFKSELISRVKEVRRLGDKLKKNFNPSVFDFGPVEILLSRHFGFCYGVENAVETAYKIIEDNPQKRIFLLSEMIHNPAVNADLLDLGVKFVQDTYGNQLVPWKTLTKEDIVIIPAFGTTLEVHAILDKIGIDLYAYDTTCPFVEKVWNRANQIGQNKYTVVVHGKPSHEETKATFSHSQVVTPTLIVKDLEQAKRLAYYIRKEKTSQEFYEEFEGQYSQGFDPEKDLERIGVVNQTTMLAIDTQEIVEYLKAEIVRFYQLEAHQVTSHFADTRDTLCYATNDNQSATYGLIAEEADFAIIAGGYNSSNTSHLVDLCREKLPSYFIKSAEKLISEQEILHFDNKKKEEVSIYGFIPQKPKVRVLLTCGASCPDAVIEEILRKLVSFFPEAKDVNEVVENWALAQA
ncbi:4-hydroxy-3-methylbut-2-enyl diphosphate reductase [Aquirufa aurantiipilula]|uniref:4-hydroxy-3-methylbut-2-enyl diphosphate reductase n=1 Tax=Aquirufa aurantiipilula TaxID=2696561 RepID=A0ABT6BKW6_9BACT|nr:4-hydroxy-3-methylbut-2-enyl diphosphate reductase [Aquirufa aurantiipilula]MBZ1327321.1 4-hydroxy-3-methylbut-2-enyl diphosphate reductase [Aquirufa aurantiipilula]MDF5691000.1 4-hydroxy-3-methylbut-2-enyl diphosphate reductase [Aquirufa aurantiipilula]